MTQDPFEALIDRVADAVVRKIDEREKINAIARAVIERIHDGDSALAANPPTNEPTPEDLPPSRKKKARKPRSKSAGKTKKDAKKTGTRKPSSNAKKRTSR